MRFINQGSILLLFSIFFIEAYSQYYPVECKINGFENRKAVLVSHYGEKTHIADSARTSETGYVKFTLSDKDNPGLYRIYFTKNYFVDLIFNYEDISIETHLANTFDSLKVLKSEETKLYHSYLNEEFNFQRKLELLTQIIDFYPVNESFYKEACKTFEEIQIQQKKYVEDLEIKYPAYYVTRIARASSIPYLSSELKGNDRNTELRLRYWENVDFSDTLLLYSTVFPDKIVQYLSLFGSQNLSQQELENEFIEAVDNILFYADQHPVLYKFIVEYLVGGFQKYGFEEVLVHIADNYVEDSSCENAERKSELQKRLQSFKELAVGKTAPDIEIDDIHGQHIQLSKINSDYTLIVFWASWCPHCEEALPALKEIYDRAPDGYFEVLSISVDSDKAAWEKSLEKGDYNWINCSELKGWNSKSANDYNIYATPTFIIVDRNLKIIGKPLSVDQVSNYIKI